VRPQRFKSGCDEQAKTRDGMSKWSDEADRMLSYETSAILQQRVPAFN
jgi:hypothetical protein